MNVRVIGMAEKHLMTSLRFRSQLSHGDVQSFGLILRSAVNEGSNILMKNIGTPVVSRGFFDAASLSGMDIIQNKHCRRNELGGAKFNRQ